jgi:hypothetical protein
VPDSEARSLIARLARGEKLVDERVAHALHLAERVEERQARVAGVETPNRDSPPRRR